MTEDQNEGEQQASGPRRGLDRVRGGAGRARQALSNSADQISGREFRRQYEEFADVVSTSVIGLDGDLRHLSKSVDELQQQLANLAVTPPDPRREAVTVPPNGPALLATFISLGLAVAAFLMAAVAIIRTL